MNRRISLQLLVTILSFVILYLFLDFSQLLSQANELGIIAFIVLLIATTFRIIFGGIRCLRASPFPHRLTLWLSVEGYLLSSYCSLFLPTAIGGDTVRIEYIARNGELPRSSAAAVVVWERASGLLALLLFLSVGILLAPILLDQGSLLIVASFTVSIVATIVLILTSRFGDGVRAPVWWATFTETLRGIQNPKKFAELVFWSLFAQFATIVIPFYFGLIMSGGDWNTAILLASITPIIWLITMIPVSLGGNGLREMSYVGIGELVGIDPMISLSAALGITFSNLIASVAGIYTFHQWSGRKSFSLESEE